MFLPIHKPAAALSFYSYSLHLTAFRYLNIRQDAGEQDLPAFSFAQKYFKILTI